MELIKKYEGAVFYVDILGITALTNNQIPLTAEDYNIWLDQYKLEYSNQYLAASILAKFREILIILGDAFNKVTISQLSDCAFVWSKDITEIVLFVSRFMPLAINSGLFCRGGMSFGEIIETNQDHRLGRFIVGKAVTDAAKLETIAKGARVMIDSDFPQNLWQQNEDFSNRINLLFTPFTNYLNFEEYDEFKWYLCPNLTSDVENLHILSAAKKIQYTKERLKIANQVRYSPLFNWNSKSKEGLVHLKASINFISENNLLDISHNFDWKSVGGQRDDNVLRVVNKQIDMDGSFKIIKS